MNDILENFIKSKRNMFSRVSGMVSPKDDKIDDFVHELDRSGVWLAGRREVRIMFHLFNNRLIYQLVLCVSLSTCAMVDNHSYLCVICT